MKQSITALIMVVSLSCYAQSEIEIVAHRGMNHLAPENTFAAGKLCYEYGIHYVEVDVRMSADSVLYVLHDGSLNRTTDGNGAISQLNSSEIDQLDAGSWFSEEYAGEPVPRLADYLAWAKGKVKIYFDVKDADLQLLVDLVYKSDFQDDCFFWFGNDSNALKLKQLAPELALKMNAGNAKQAAKAVEKYNAQIIECRPNDLSQEFIETCHGWGLKVMVYTKQNTLEEYREVLKWPVDMVNLDRGDLFIQAVEETD